MKFRILGSLQVDGPKGQPLQLEPRQTRLLATLLLAADHVVTRSRLIEAVWDNDPPDTVDRQLKNLVSALRRRLAAGGTGQIDFDSTGYRITVDVHELDASVFAEHLTRADALRSDGQIAAAAQQLRTGLALWRGPALDGCAARTVEAAALRLNEQHMAATEQCMELELQLGRHRDLVGELTELAAAYPLRERLVGQLMLALYRCGRTADALNAYQRLRARLSDELGIDPGPALQKLHTAILRNDPAASPPPQEDTTRGGTTQTRRRTPVRHIVGKTALLNDRTGLASRTARTSAASPTMTCTLPGDMAAFTGRSDHLDKIVAEARAAAHEGRAAAVYAINGMPGVGKTALAVHLGHMLKDRFPDRQLFLDLHAHTIDQVPVDTHKALAHLLSADGVDARYLPDDTDERAAMWRDRMAGRRVLLILDNATDSRHIAPLIPDTTGSLVLVTSRRYLGDLPQARVTIPLELLPPDEAVQVFVRLAPRAQEASPAVVRELVSLCGHLPLAISILASIYTKHPSWTVEDLLRETSNRRLDAAAEYLSVARAFGLSYQYLSVDEQRLFRYLGVHPGVECDPYAAAALAGLPVEAASDLLDQLHSAGLLIEPTFRRYRMHDLLRDYARALALDEASDDREGALGRLLDYYQHCAQTADAQLVRHTRPGTHHPAVPGPPAAPDVSQRARARAWIRSELPNLLACIAYAERQNMPARAIDLTAGVAAYLRTDGPWDLAIDLHTNAVTSAEHLGDRSRTAEALYHLGAMRRLTNEYPAAVTALQQAMDLYHGLDDPRGRANTIHELGIVWRLTRDLPSATTAVQQALAQYGDLGDLLGQANALYELAVLQGMTGDFPTASTTARQAQDIYRSIDDQHGYANTLNVIGAVSRETGDFRTATASLQDASDLYRDIDDRLGQANAMMELGVVRRRIGELLNAATLLEQAYELFRDLGHRHGQAIAILELGVVRRQAGDLAAATSNAEEALRIYHDLGSRNGQAHALLEQGTLYRVSGSFREAVTTLQESLHLVRDLGHRPGEAEVLQELGLAQAQAGDAHGGTARLKQALDLFRDLGHRHGEAEALNRTGVLHLAHGDVSQSRVYHERALELARTIIIPLEEAGALEGIGRCALALGEPDAATSHLRQALEIYQRIGAGDAPRLATELEQAT